MKKMRYKFRSLLILLLVFPFSLSAADYVRTVHQGFEKSTIGKIKVQNKFGDVHFIDQGGDSITVDVKISIDNRNSDRAEDLANSIDIAINLEGNTLTMQTTIPGNFKTKRHFSIDYYINTPDSIPLDVQNKFGNVILNDLNAKALFNINYGNLTANSFLQPFELNLKYGKANFDDCQLLTGTIGFSKIYLDKAETINLTTKYSGLTADKVNKLILKSGFDQFNIDELNTIQSTSSYSNYKIGKIYKSLNLETGFGSVQVDQVDPNFDSIILTNSYGGIHIGIPEEANYQLSAKSKFGSIKYPTNQFHGVVNKDGQHTSLEGSVGPEGANRTVTIKSSFGTVDLLN